MPKKSGPRPRRWAPVGAKGLPPAATRIPSGSTITWGGVPVYVYEAPEWYVEPRDTVTGSVGSFVQWQAKRILRAAPRSEVQMVRYECRIQAVDPGVGGYGTREALVFEFDVFHRPDDGDIVLGAKVLSMAVTRPEWKLYKEKVAEGW